MTKVQALGAGTGVLMLLLLLVAGDDNSAANTSYLPKEYILLSCGFAGLETDKLNRNWIGDTDSRYAPSLKATGSLVLQYDSSVPQVPYLTARVFTSSFTYYFPLNAGRKFIRLHFYPTNYSSTYAVSDALFSATSGSTTFLSNFNVSATAQALNLNYLIKEFSVSVTTGGMNLTFTPSSSYADAYAFINGIEIVSTPDLFKRIPLLFNSGTQSLDPIGSDWALETVHRLNVGGKSVSPTEDSGLYRSWSIDALVFSGESFLYDADGNATIAYTTTNPSYMAPKVVYSSARSMGPNYQRNLRTNLTWHLFIDAGFEYLVRIHFCEIDDAITKPNQRTFHIFINNQIAEKGFDVISWSGGKGIPIYKDFVVGIAGSGKMDLPIALHPNQNSLPQYVNVILNGLEVFKLQNKNGSLAGFYPIMQPLPPVDTRKSKRTVTIVGIIGGFLVLLLTGFFFAWLYQHQKRKVKGAPSDEIHSSALPHILPHSFTFAEIIRMTENFHESRFIGQGGYGIVYRGKMDDGTEVAIKRGQLLSENVDNACQNEIDVLSQLQHRNIVPLIGFCNEIDEDILVYQYTAYGNLRENLYSTSDKEFQSELDWRQRLKICIEVARGLIYLHEKRIIHCDVNTSNILLDEKGVAKISEFGLAKWLSPDDTNATTVVNGSCSYIDPVYTEFENPTQKTDVYSFGVVLLEVLCARKAANDTLSHEQKYLADWAKICQRKGTIIKIDPCLQGKIVSPCFEFFLETALKCVANSGTERPMMKDVLKSLESALEMQEAHS